MSPEVRDTRTLPPAAPPLTAAPVRPRPGLPPPGVLLAALAVAGLRLPFVHGWLGKDEAGFLDVAQHWHAGGSSLYGNYWVDRPPMLITIFRAAASLGGAVPLRLIGIGAAVVTVLAVARAAHVLAGRRAASWAAVAAAAFLVSPLTGSIEVNGELLAAPFVAIGIAGAAEALTAVTTRRALATSAVAGAVGLLAILVKQNMLDVFVFGGVMLILTARSVGVSRLAAVVAGTVGGAAAAGAAMTVWTLRHGTSPAGVWFAMYRFRLEANAIMATDPAAGAGSRWDSLVFAAAFSGMSLVAVLLLVAVLRGRRDHPSSSVRSRVGRMAQVALVVTVGYDVLSIWLGESYWSHYLIQLVVPLCLAAGLAVVHRPRTGRFVIALLVVSAAVSLVLRLQQPASPGGNRLGEAIGAVAHPGDTIVTIWGHPDVTWSSHLPSPYPYLWYLPARTLDPQVALLTSTLTGPHAPTWFVDWSGVGLHGVDTSALRSALKQDYRKIGVFSGHKVYLHRGVRRHEPAGITADSRKHHPRRGSQVAGHVR